MTVKKTRPEKKGRFNPGLLKAVLIILGMFILYIVLVKAWQFAGMKLMDTAVLGVGEIKKLYSAEGVLIREETAIASPADGELVMLVKPGARVRAGESIAEVKTIGGVSGEQSATALVRASRTGVVSLRLDGLEGVLKPGQSDLFDIGKIELNNSKENKGDQTSDIRCGKGQPVVKVVDNLSPLIICLRVPGGLPPELVKKGGILPMVWNGQQIEGRVSEMGNYAGGVQITVEVYNYPSAFLDIRRTSLELVGEKIYGFVVPVEALEAREGREGLYILNKTGIKWVPVMVKGTVGGTAAVSGDQLPPGARYVLNPGWLPFAGD